MSENEFAMVSDWMTNGDINEFVEKNPDVDRFGLVGFHTKPTFFADDNNEHPLAGRCR